MRVASCLHFASYELRVALTVRVTICELHLFDAFDLSTGFQNAL